MVIKASNQGDWKNPLISLYYVLWGKNKKGMNN